MPLQRLLKWSNVGLLSGSSSFWIKGLLTRKGGAMANSRRYQVFVSSTFEDLRSERQAVIQALLELECIPAGMELFPAADADQWSLIKSVIDGCDYYIVIIAGRYGSVSPSTGKSFTQMEYEYAISTGKPVIAFLHDDPSTLPVKQTEKLTRGQEALQEFRDLATKHVCKFWHTAQELAGVVISSIVHLISTKPAVGWIRADSVTDERAVGRLKQKVVKYEKQLRELRSAGLLKVTTSPYSDIEWSSLFKEVKSIDLFFTYAKTWRKSHVLELRKFVEQEGHVLRVVLPDPEGGSTIDELARRSSCARDQLLERLYEATSHFLHLALLPGARAEVQVWFVPILPLFSLFRFDKKGVLSLHTHRRVRRAVITLLFGSGNLLEYCSSEFEALLEQYSGARRVSLESIPPGHRSAPIDL